MSLHLPSYTSFRDISLYEMHTWNKRDTTILLYCSWYVIQ